MNGNVTHLSTYRSTRVGGAYRRNDYVFPRTQRESGTDHVPIERSAPLQPLWKDVVAAMFLVAFITAAFVLGWMVA